MRTTKSFSVTVPKELVTEIERAAKGQGRSRSSYLAWLIRKDAQVRARGALPIAPLTQARLEISPIFTSATLVGGLELANKL
jgi:hypothetical protein